LHGGMHFRPVTLFCAASGLPPSGEVGVVEGIGAGLCLKMARRAIGFSPRTCRIQFSQGCGTALSHRFSSDCRSDGRRLAVCRELGRAQPRLAFHRRPKSAPLCAVDCLLVMIVVVRRRRQTCKPTQRPDGAVRRSSGTSDRVVPRGANGCGKPESGDGERRASRGAG
jgi:hypothetical protein